MKNCEPNCIEDKSTLCIVYEGPDIPDKGIQAGDRLNDVISKLTASEEVVVEESMSINTQGVKSISSCATQITDTAFTYNISPSNNTIIISWTIPNNLPSGFNLYTTTVNAYGNGLIGSSSSASDSISVPLNRFPVSLDIKQRVGTSCGDVVLSKTINLSSSLDAKVYKNYLEIEDLSNSASPQTSEEAINSIYSTLSRHQQSIEDFKVSDCESKINLLEQQLSNLANSDVLAEITYSDQNVDLTGDLTSVLSDIYKCVREVKADIQRIDNEIASMKINIENIPAIIAQ